MWIYWIFPLTIIFQYWPFAFFSKKRIRKEFLSYQHINIFEKIAIFWQGQAFYKKKNYNNIYFRIKLIKRRMLFQRVISYWNSQIVKKVEERIFWQKVYCSFQVYNKELWKLCQLLLVKSLNRLEPYFPVWFRNLMKKCWENIFYTQVVDNRRIIKGFFWA